MALNYITERKRKVAGIPRILTVQDISCVGQCSATVALPVISACGVEACIMPSAILSTHTGGFHGFTFRDLTADMPGIERHWLSEGIRFQAVSSGYLASAMQIDIVRDLMDRLLLPGGVKIVDPAMADHGKLYYGFDQAFVEKMSELCAAADYILPNLTEACFLTGTPYRQEIREPEEIRALLEKLVDEYKVDGVVEIDLQACTAYTVESTTIRRKMESLGMPYMAIETDYSLSDSGQLATRLEAFLEML